MQWRVCNEDGTISCRNTVHHAAISQKKVHQAPNAWMDLYITAQLVELDCEAGLPHMEKVTVCPTGIGAVCRQSPSCCVSNSKALLQTPLLTQAASPAKKNEGAKYDVMLQRTRLNHNDG